jgi:hypothetical protein
MIETLEERILLFKSKIKAKIENLDESDFEYYKSSLVCILKKPFINLEELEEYCFDQFLSGSIDLNLNLKISEKLTTFKKEDLISSPLFKSMLE